MNIPDDSVEYEYDVPNSTYHKYCKSIYSQNGEDGLLEQIFKELEIKDGIFCEFGAYDGIAYSNSYRLSENNFSGMLIESDLSRFLNCVENYKKFPMTQVYYGSVNYKDPNLDLNAWLKKGRFPLDFDFLSIDIDGDDYHVWEQLTQFEPKVVLIETNPFRDPIFEELPGHPSEEYNIDLLNEWNPIQVANGCSFLSAIQLGLKKGYIPVAYTANILFVRKDLIHKLTEFPYKISDDPYDYITLYSHLSQNKDKWHTNAILIINMAIRDYYLTFKKKQIDRAWLQQRVNEIIKNENLIF